MDDKALQKGKKLFISSKIILLINNKKLYLYIFIYKAKKREAGGLKKIEKI
jgi:hypothetical protein